MKISPMTLLPLGLVTAIAGGALLYSSPNGASFVSEAFADPLKVLSARSPGARAAGALTQTKARKVAEKALLDNALIADRPPVIFSPHTHVPPSVDILTPDALPLGPVLIDTTDAPQTLFPAYPIYFPTPGGGVLFPGGGGGTPGTPGGGGGGETPGTPGTPTPAVPEPATWAMLLLGFGLVGGALRRREGWEGGRLRG